MFLLHRIQGGRDLCNAPGRDGHMLLFRKLSSQFYLSDHEDVFPSDKLLHYYGLAFGLLSTFLHLIQKEQNRISHSETLKH